MRYLTGFLSPAGDFVWCPSYSHLETSSDLCQKYGYQQQSHLHLPEDTLLYNGWICLRVRDVYKAPFNTNGEVILLSHKQQEWLQNHRRNFNISQLAHIEQIIKDFGSISEWQATNVQQEHPKKEDSPL